MIPYITHELKELKTIDRDVKSDWLGVLNRELTLSQGKVEPHTIFDNKTFLAKLRLFLKTKYKKERSLKAMDIKNVDDDGWMTEYYCGSFQIWLWGLNKVIHQIPRELSKHVNDPVDFDKVPPAPLFRLPQWSTMIDINLNAVPPEEGQPDYRLALVNIVRINDKDYLNCRIFVVPADTEIKDIYWKTVSLGFYIAKDTNTLEEGILKAEKEITPCHDDKHNHFLWMKYEKEKDLMNSMLNLIMFVTSEYSKHEMKKTETEWYGKGQLVSPTGYKIKPRVSPVNYVVGEQYIETLSRTSREFSGRISHFRKGHFKTYWLGPRSEPQTPIVHWIPPMVIKGSIASEETV